MIAFSTSDRFAPLDGKDRDRLDALSKLDQFAGGQEIATGEWLSLIVQGEVELRAPRRGDEVVLARLGPGDLFGELQPFVDLPQGTRHVARGETIVRAVNKDPLLQELKVHRPLTSGLLAVYCRSISEKIRAANELVKAPAAPQTARPPHLSEDEIAWLSVLGQPLDAAPGEAVVREGDASREFYVVREGELEVRKEAASGQPARALARLSSRDLFGILAFVDGKPRSASVVPLSTAKLVRIEPDALEKAARVNFTTGFKFLGTLCTVLGRTYGDTIRAVLES